MSLYMPIKFPSYLHTILSYSFSTFCWYSILSHWTIIHRCYFIFAAEGSLLFLTLCIHSPQSFARVMYCQNFDFWEDVCAKYSGGAYSKDVCKFWGGGEQFETLGFQLRVCWIFIDKYVLNNSGKYGWLYFFLVIYMKAFIFRCAV
jgi:hypothetical protein